MGWFNKIKSYIYLALSFTILDELKEKFILDNAEIKSMINAFGCGFSTGLGNDFDISKLNYDKIIIMSDADKRKFSNNILSMSPVSEMVRWKSR